MCECQGNLLARVTLALGLPYLLVNRVMDKTLTLSPWTTQMDYHKMDYV